MRTVVAIIAVLVGCADTESSRGSVRTYRYVDQLDRYALDAPENWSVSRDRGSAIFTAPNGKKQTIVVRAAAKPKQLVEGRDTTTADVTAATERVLGGLPYATIERRWTITAAGMPARAFALEFSPPGVSRRYQRIHVVAVGAEQLFHLIYTAPVEDRISEVAIEQMVVGLREEG